jgi:hypothetical protein
MPEPTSNFPFSGACLTTLAIAFVLLVLPAPEAVQTVGALTLLEGPLRVVRGTNSLKGVEGMRLRQGDILESSDAGFAQLEFAGGAVVALGPGGRLYVHRHGGDKQAEGKGAAELLLLSGWLKGESSSGAGTYRYETPTIAATTAAGTVLMHAFGDGSEVFVESGSATLGEVGEDGGIRQPIAAKAGQYFSRHPGKALVSFARLNPSFIEAMPHPFRDTLPSRMAHFAGKTIEPKIDHQVLYADVESYLRMPLAWRRGMAERFQSRLSDADFRKQVESHLAEHPEWDKILHPEQDPKEQAKKP